MFDLMKIGEVVVNVDAAGRYSLNDLHKASGGMRKDMPSMWLRSAQTEALIHELVAESESIFKSQICDSEQNQPLSVVHGGSEQGTYACKELVYAYAMWISPSFNLRVIRAFDNIQQVKQQTQGAVDLEDPEFLQGLLMKYAEDKKRLTQEKAQLESKVVVQDTVIAVQEEQIHSLQNLFNEGMTPSAFVKQLNGCNANAISAYLEEIGWSYSRERKVGKDWFVYAGVRDKFLRQSSYCPNLNYPQVRVHTVQLTKQGAVKLYEMYLEGKLPMKKGWDGKFTHDVI